MKTGHILLTVVLAVLMGVVGAAISRTVMPRQTGPESALHTVLHKELKLDADQRAKLEAMNSGFYARKAKLEAKLRADDAALAAAIADEHGYGPGVAAAVDQAHHTMSELQKETLEHVFAMRTLLKPDQTARYDAAVQKALTASEN